MLIGSGYIFLGKRVITLIRGMREPIAIAFSTASSEAALPQTLDQLEKFGVSRRIATWLKREALRVLSAETDEFADWAGVTVTKVAVGDPKTRWGSCAASGTIRYSWRLILMPDFVRRSTVAHEVAHRLHMDHSARFYRVLEMLDERDPDESRRWLRANGAALHWVGRES